MHKEFAKQCTFLILKDWIVYYTGGEVGRWLLLFTLGNGQRVEMIGTLPRCRAIRMGRDNDQSDQDSDSIDNNE